MPTATVDAVSTLGATSTSASKPGMDALTSEDFFKILVTEMQQQDPLEPTDTGAMIGQVSQIRSIELSEKLSGVLSRMSEQQYTAGTADLLGKYVTADVEADDGTKEEVSGVVTGVRFDSDGSAVLELDTGQSVRAADVTHITSIDTADLPPSADDDEAGAAAADQSTNDKSEQAAKQRSDGPLSWLADIFNL